MKGVAIVDEMKVSALQFIERDIPRPAFGEVLVRIRAVSLNFRDIHVIEGIRNITLPLIPVSDAAGDVVEIGEGVTAFAVGDRVMSNFFQGWISGARPPAANTTLGGPLDGVLVEYRVFPVEGLVRTPDFLTDLEAAALPCAGVSAWNALFVSATVQPGDVVVVQGTGGVSLFALQFAKLAGARVIATSSAYDKLERVKAMGADEVINYKEYRDWGKRVRELAGKAADLVVEVGGAGTFEQSLDALRNAGQMSFVGFVTGTKPNFDLSQIAMKGIRIHGIRVGNRDSHEDMLRAMVQHHIRPVVGRVHAFEDAIEAIAAFKAGGHFGKVCISIA
jgi:NADPH:quinone reductase-like Zn-dependent oxidoreductase